VTTVLFTCAGQRVDIVTAFRRAGATTVATDVDRLAPALYHADVRALTPRVDDPGYVDALRELVALHDVGLVVPLTDLDHRELANARDDLGGAIPLVSGLEAIERCSDKYLAHEFFSTVGIGSPPTWLPGELPDDVRFPALV
jgi:carbamoyl-phosphate synthase large subunit